MLNIADQCSYINKIYIFFLWIFPHHTIQRQIKWSTDFLMRKLKSSMPFSPINNINASLSGCSQNSPNPFLTQKTLWLTRKNWKKTRKELHESWWGFLKTHLGREERAEWNSKKWIFEISWELDEFTIFKIDYTLFMIGKRNK